MEGNNINNNTDNNINMNQPINKRPNNGRDLFYGVIAVAVFIVMAVGATFAYFTATANSGSSDVGTRSATISMDFISYGSAWSNDDLIPADRAVAEYAVELQDDTTGNDICKDDTGRSVCSIYEFAVYSTDEQPITQINLISDNNEFQNLNAMIYEVSKDSTITKHNDETGEDVIVYDNPDSTGNTDPVFKMSQEDAEDTSKITVTKGDSPIYLSEEDNSKFTPIYVNRKGAKKSLLKYDDNSAKKPSIGIEVAATGGNVTLANYDSTGGVLNLTPGTPRHFIIVLYIKNLDENQTLVDSGENGKIFIGSVEVVNGEGGGVQGRITASEGTSLQGDETDSGTGSTEPGTEPQNP